MVNILMCDCYVKYACQICVHIEYLFGLGNLLRPFGICKCQHFWYEHVIRFSGSPLRNEMLIKASQSIGLMILYIVFLPRLVD